MLSGSKTDNQANVAKQHKKTCSLRYSNPCQPIKNHLFKPEISLAVMDYYSLPKIIMIIPWFALLY